MRKPVAFLVAIYAIVFAFLAMTVVRWPTLMTAVAMMFQEESRDLAGFDWRTLGLQYGVPYLAAAVFFQTSSYALATRQHGAFTAFVFGCATAFPCVFVFEMREGWMAAPTHEEWILIWIVGGTLLLLGAVWDLRRRPNQEPIRQEPLPRVRNDELEWRTAGLPAGKNSDKKSRLKAEELPPQVLAGPVEVPTKPKKRPQRRPVPPAIAAQRRKWAEEGRRQIERKNKRRGG